MSDGRGGSASATFDWTVLTPPAVIESGARAARRRGQRRQLHRQRPPAADLEYAGTSATARRDRLLTASPSVTHTLRRAGPRTRVTLSVRDDRRPRHDAQLHAGGRRRADRGAAERLVEHRARAAQRRQCAPVGRQPRQRHASACSTRSTNAKLAEIAVGSGPRTLAVAGDGRVWVANQDGASLSVISPHDARGRADGRAAARVAALRHRVLAGRRQRLRRARSDAASCCAERQQRRDHRHAGGRAEPAPAVDQRRRRARAASRASSRRRCPAKARPVVQTSTGRGGEVVIVDAAAAADRKRRRCCATATSPTTRCRAAACRTTSARQ